MVKNDVDISFQLIHNFLMVEKLEPELKAGGTVVGLDLGILCVQGVFRNTTRLQLIIQFILY